MEENSVESFPTGAHRDHIALACFNLSSKIVYTLQHFAYYWKTYEMLSELELVSFFFSIFFFFFSGNLEKDWIEKRK